jgi:hypothetical protein
VGIVNDNLHFVRCILDGNTVTGIYLTGIYGEANYVDITGCYAANATSASSVCIDVESCSGVIVRGCDVRIEGSYGGILFNGANSVGNVAAHNQCYSLYSGTIPYFIKLDGVTNSSVVGNITQTAGSSYIGTVGIWLVSSTYNSITSNALGGYLTTGLTYDSASTGNASTGNVAGANVTTAKSDSGSNGTGV